MSEDGRAATKSRGRPSWPRCGSELVLIISGMPTRELIEAEARGEVVLGGCCLPDPSEPDVACAQCQPLGEPLE